MRQLKCVSSRIRPAMTVLPGLFSMILLAFANTGFAQQFAGQTVNVIVNFSAGGPTDIEARIVAAHLPKYLQGVNAVIVRNLGGGGGRIAVNQLGTASSTRDRLNIGYFTWNPIDQIIQEPTLLVRYNDLKVIAGVVQASLLYIRRDTPPGINKPADIARSPLIRVGTLGPTNRGWIRMRLALELLGVKYEAIPGYKGLSDIDIALQRNDVQMSTNALSGYFASTKPNLVDTGIAIPFLQYDRADGLPGRSPDLPDVPTFLELYKDVFGKDAMPSGEKWEMLQFLTRLLDTMFRSVFMAPGAPAPAVEEMRGAFAKLGKDPEFIAQYEKVAFSKLRFIMGAQAERVIAELDHIKPSMVSFLRKYMGMPQ